MDPRVEKKPVKKKVMTCDSSNKNVLFQTNDSYFSQELQSSTEWE